MFHPTITRRLLAGTCVLLLASAGPAHTASTQDQWVEAFGASPAAYADDIAPVGIPAKSLPKATPATGTVRFTFALATGGQALRIRLTNEAGDRPLRIDAASVALAGATPGSVNGTIVPLRFQGQPSITVPIGAPVLSDPVALTTTALGRVVVSVYTTGGAAFHPLGGGRMLIAPGDQTGAMTLTGATPRSGRPLVSGAAVSAARPMPVVVTLGDSLTDGLRGEPDVLHGYPEQLAIRFAKLPRGKQRAVVNAGIGGNRVLENGWGQSALARLDRDVLRLGGVSHVVLFEGINDIGMIGLSVFGPPSTTTPETLIAGYRQIVARAHARGIKVIGATLMPFQGAGYYNPQKEQIRERVNAWIRGTRDFDGVIDFEAAVRDPANPLKLRKEYDSGDHLHPNDAGARAMGDAIDLRLFR